MKCIKRKISFFILFFVVFMIPVLLIPVMKGVQVDGVGIVKAIATGAVIAVLATWWQMTREKKKGIDCE